MGGGGNQESGSLTAVAIDKDKNSQQAVKWALENMFNKSHNLILVHVFVQQNILSTDDTPNEGRPPTEDETRNLFLPFRGFCARKGVTAKEVVLVGPDVPSALAEYICACSISNIVLGASSRSVLTRAFRALDVPTSLGKSVPDFCSVYAVSSRGRVQNIRTASRPPPSTITCSRQSSRSSLNLSIPDTLSSADFSNQGIWRSSASSAESPDGSGSQRERRGSQNPLPMQSANDSIKWETLSSTSSTSSSNNSSANLSVVSITDNTQTVPLFRQLGNKNMGSEIQQEKSRTGNKIPSPVKTMQQMMHERHHDNKIPNNLNLRGHIRDTSFCSATESEVSGPTNYSSNVSFDQFDHSVVSDASVQSISSSKGGDEDEELKRLRQEFKRTLELLNGPEMAQNVAELESQKRKHTELRSQRETREKTKAIDVLTHNVQYKNYVIEEIEVATQYFSPSEKIGEGGYGPVYRAIMDRTAVAIKVLRPDIPQGHKQFHQEVEILSRMRHPNMVLLVGACPEYGCLVYEYMENGCLDDRLFRKNNSPPIPWDTRFKIAAEIASALHFLHQTKPSPLVHRDLKPANILLDRNYVSKISDVGLARLVPPSVADCVTQYQVTAAAGTFCYIDPEYQQTGKLSTKSDIYSLGVLLLQIITARPPMGLTHNVERAIEKGDFADILDPAVSGWPVQDALSYAKLALKCCELRGRDRPDLGSVILPELERLRDLRLNSS